MGVPLLSQLGLKAIVKSERTFSFLKKEKAKSIQRNSKRLIIVQKTLGLGSSSHTDKHSPTAPGLNVPICAEIGRCSHPKDLFLRCSSVVPILLLLHIGLARMRLLSVQTGSCPSTGCLAPPLMESKLAFFAGVIFF